MLNTELKSADWKTEKHVPAIVCPDQVTTGKSFQVTVTLGKEVAHPNKTEHHSRYITLFFKPEGSPVPYQIGHFEFSAHGESPEGPNEGPVYTDHTVTASKKTSKPGTLLALPHCNIHGLWQSEKAITIA